MLSTLRDLGRRGSFASRTLMRTLSQRVAVDDVVAAAAFDDVAAVAAEDDVAGAERGHAGAEQLPAGR